MSKIRIRHGENEIELDGTDQFISKHLDQFYEKISAEVGKVPRATLKQQLLDEPAPPKSGKAPTPAEFYRSKGKKDGLSQLLIFARYLEEFEGKSEFSPGEVNKVAKDAKLSKDIHPQYFANAVKQGLLRKHGRGDPATLDGFSKWRFEDELMAYAEKHARPGEHVGGAVMRLSREDEVAKALARAAYWAEIRMQQSRSSEENLAALRKHLGS